MQHAVPPLPLQQSPLYHDALRRLGAAAAFVPMPGGAILALSRRWPLLGKITLLSRPALWRCGALPGLPRAFGAGALIINAASPADGARLWAAGYLRLARPRNAAILSLAGTQADWLARMDGKWRNRLRHAQRQSLRLIGERTRGRDLSIVASPMPPDPGHWLLRAEAAQQRARGYRNLPPVLVAALAASPDGLHLYTARIGHTPIAAMLFACHGREASYLIGWSDARGRKLSTHNLILWRAMGDLAARGVDTIDLGHCDPVAAAGLARFKQGAGAVVMPMGGTWAAIGALAPFHALMRRLRVNPRPHATAAPVPAARR